jgi:hypothetical protein
VAGAIGIELANSRLQDFSFAVLIFSVELEGFEMTKAKAIGGITKSATIPLELVQSLWRKIHSPSPPDSCLARSLKFSEAQTSAKLPDFWDYCTPDSSGGWKGVAVGEELRSNLLRGSHCKGRC